SNERNDWGAKPAPPVTAGGLVTFWIEAVVPPSAEKDPVGPGPIAALFGGNGIWSPRKWICGAEPVPGRVRDPGVGEDPMAAGAGGMSGAKDEATLARTRAESQAVQARDRFGAIPTPPPGLTPKARRRGAHGGPK